VLTRSVATSSSTLFPVTALLLFGGETLKDFAFALLVGIASGTYSSIFIASPVLTEWKEREPGYRNRRRRIVDELGYVPAYAVTTTAGVPEAERAPAPRPPERKPERVAAVEVDGHEDGVVEEIQLEAAHDEHELELEQPAPVGSRADAQRDAELRAQRAARKKQRAARQRKARKHGRRR
jgi:SecD/SecF fusion protein